jgi:hypothetical protein
MPHLKFLKIAALSAALPLASVQAGDLTVTALGSVPDLSDYTVTTTINYELGVGVSAGTEFLYRVTLNDSFLWNTSFADSYLTISNDATANAAASITIRSGGGIGDTFVEYRIILGNGAGEDISSGTILSLTTGSSFGVTHNSLGGLTETTITGRVDDDFGEFDTGGTHTTTLAQVSVVPEPDTYGTMLGLLSLIGVIWIKRRPRHTA